MSSPGIGWADEFAKCGAYWLHDGNPKRPYARLTSGLISNGFFNGGRIAEEDPALLGVIAGMLWRHSLGACTSRPVTRVIGAAYGGIALATRIGEAGRVKSGFAERTVDHLFFARPALARDEHFLLTEDTITTGGTVRELQKAAKQAAAFCTFAPVILAICNRSGSKEIDGVPILSVISPTFETWKEGENPYTPDGKELVEPVRPKMNWDALTRDYP